MSGSPRTNKPRKGHNSAKPAAARGRGAWGGGANPAYGGPSFATSPERQYGSVFPPPQQLQYPILMTLVNSLVLLTTRAHQRLEGVLVAIVDDNGTPGAVLRDARDVANPGVPIQATRFVATQFIASCVPAQGQPGAFCITEDLAAGGALRAPWATNLPPANPSADVDGLAFGASTGASQSWEANQGRFGVVTSFNEESLTAAPDYNFIGTEGKVEINAKQTMGSSTSDSHIVEGYGAVDDSGMNEEDRQSSVVHGQNAYIPPSARQAVQPNGSSSPSPALVPKPLPPFNTNNIGTAGTPPDSKLEVTNRTEANLSNQVKAGKSHRAGSFREFVANEKLRLAQKKQEKRMAELVALGQKLKPISPFNPNELEVTNEDKEAGSGLKVTVAEGGDREHGEGAESDKYGS
ncbi:hypothetical protein BDV93DRAFT_549081 [Ceratobasidium sp. AG-I]|nr:hypothetical protein BDV93DRAFT_549081 [Ceratobasidium sp. AG-I]